ncbi:hypothetical protein KAT92_05445 [Candidatus Babeliales bacterium]|nr:hypothetical protein [Candidatus Babeliales bacterium]
MKNTKLIEIEIDFKISEANDTHFLAPHATTGFNRVMNGGVDLLLGDIIDLDLCKKKKVTSARELQDTLIEVYKMRFVSGNHSLMFYNIFVVLILPNGVRILATHGDYLFYDKDRADNYRNRDEGSGFIRRGGAKILDGWRLNFRDPRIKDDVMYRAVELMREHDCSTLICGHSHRNKLGTKTKHGYTFHVLPKGINEILFSASGRIEKLVNIR